MSNRSLILAKLGCLCLAFFLADLPEMKGKISRVSDGDTVFVTLSNGTEEKIRLWVADCPEVSHNSKEEEQPGSQEAKK